MLEWLVDEIPLNLTLPSFTDGPMNGSLRVTELSSVNYTINNSDIKKKHQGKEVPGGKLGAVLGEGGPGE